MTMTKQQLQAMLDQQITRYTEVYGGEIKKYASPEKPDRIITGVSRKIPNLKEQECQDYLALVKAGKYTPETQYQTRKPSNKSIRLEELA